MKLTAGPTSAYMLGTLHGEPAIIHVARTSLDTKRAPQLVKDGLENLDVFLDNRPVSLQVRQICALRSLGPSHPSPVRPAECTFPGHVHPHRRMLRASMGPRKVAGFLS